VNKRDHVLNAVLLGIGLGFVAHPAGDLQTVTTVAAVLVPVLLGALLPDVDTELGHHRKTLHNVFVLAVLYGYTAVFANLAFVWIGVVTHLVLDVLGTRRGVAFLYPFWDAELGLPVGVPTDSAYATFVTLVVTGLELAAAAALLHSFPGVLGLVDAPSRLSALAGTVGV